MKQRQNSIDLFRSRSVIPEFILIIKTDVSSLAIMRIMMMSYNVLGFMILINLQIIINILILIFFDVDLGEVNANRATLTSLCSVTMHHCHYVSLSLCIAVTMHRCSSGRGD